MSSDEVIICLAGMSWCQYQSKDFASKVDHNFEEIIFSLKLLLILIQNEK